MSIRRFFSAGLADAVARTAQWTEPATDDPEFRWSLLRESLAGRAAAKCRELASRAVHESAVVATVRHATSRWKASSLRERYGCIAIVCLTAPVTHVVLMLPTRPVGALWLMVPGMVAAFGLAAATLAALMPAGANGTEARR